MRNEFECYVLGAYGDTPQSRALIQGYREGCSNEESRRLIAKAAEADNRIFHLTGKTSSKWVGDREAG